MPRRTVGLPVIGIPFSRAFSVVSVSRLAIEQDIDEGPRIRDDALFIVAPSRALEEKV
jgi:hypothetical protein